MLSTETTTGSIPGVTGLQLEDRRDAGLRLAEKLRSRDLSAELVLALPRGGLAVGFEIAAGLGIPLDVFLVRKLGVPFQPELAFGAIAHGGARVLNSDILAQLDLEPDEFDGVAAVERDELERRERAYRGDRPFPPVSGRTVILVDDGAATGASMLVAVRALRQLGAKRVVVALPVVSPQALRQLQEESDEVVCLAAPEPFYAVGIWYHDFPQVTDQEVRTLLERAACCGSSPLVQPPSKRPVSVGPPSVGSPRAASGGDHP